MAASPPRSPAVAHVANCASGSIVTSAMQRRRQLFEAAPAQILPSAIGHLLVGAFLASEVTSHTCYHALCPSWTPYHALAGGQRLLLDGAAYFLLAVCMASLLYSFYNFWFPLGIGWRDVPLTREQMDLLGIDPGTTGFTLSPKRPGGPMNPNPFGPPMRGGFLSPPAEETSYYPSSPQSGPASPASAHASPSAGFNSSFGEIRDEKMLRGYLSEFEEWERSRGMGSFNAGQGGGNNPNGSILDHSGSPNMSLEGSFWKPNAGNVSGGASPSHDYSPLLRNLNYSLSVPMPGSKTAAAPDTKASGDSATSPSSRIYLVADPLEIVSWLENLRMYLSATILNRLTAKVNSANKALSKLGLDLQVGDSGLEKVKRVAAMHHHQQVPQGIAGLGDLIPFLEVSVHQDYIVNRIKELGAGGAMSGFKWNGGGRYKGKDWTDVLPTDTELLMHVFVCYMDARLPPLGGVVDGRAFSARYFFRLSEDKKAEVDKAAKRVPVAIVQTRLGTSKEGPHYILQMGSNQVEVSRGRNNLFHTLLAFIHHLVSKESGMLGRVSLGRAGLNMSWIIEEQKMLS